MDGPSDWKRCDGMSPTTVCTPCARIRSDQRREMAPDDVPYCEFIDADEDGKHDFFTAEGFRAVEEQDGSVVSCDTVPKPKSWVCREGYRLPPVRFDTAGL